MLIHNIFSKLFISHKRKNFKISFLSCIAIYLLITFVHFGADNHPSSYTAIINGSFLSLMNIILSYFYGYLWLPMSSLSFVFSLSGILNGWHNDPDPFFFNQIIIQICIWIASILISILSERDMRIRVKNEWLSVSDGLTGLYNYRYFNNKLEEEFEKVRKKGTGFISLCLIDVDNFKRFNDRYGHSSGDRVLQIVSDILRKSIRKTDTACRYGGDELAVIMPDAQKEDVLSVINQIKTEISNNQSFSSNSSNADITLSMGFSTYPTLADSKESLFEQADNALYKAKNSGRNTFKMYQNIISDITKDTDDYTQLTKIIRVLLLTISEKDKYTYGHSERVAELVVRIGKALNLPIKKIRELEIEGLLHDIGKLKIPNQVLNKKGSLTDEEFELIKKHPIYSASIINSLSILENFEDDVKHHHERYDGKGYPDALIGTDIPIGSRILAVADSFDAMRSDRPYRKNNLSYKMAVQELIDNAGTQFDPQVVNAFINCIKS